MLEAVFDSVVDASFTVGAALLGILVAILLGVAVGLTYYKTIKSGASMNFVLTLIVLPAVICVIILLVGSNVARAFSLAGAFSLVRFRSEPGDPKDIAYVCLVMAIGLSTGMGYLSYAVLFTVILCAVLIAFSLVATAVHRSVRYLRITIPEDLNYTDAFEGVFREYTANYVLTRVRTCDLGSLFRLDYTVTLKDARQEKELIDQLRCRNGNLDISMLMTPVN